MGNLDQITLPTIIVIIAIISTSLYAFIIILLIRHNSKYETRKTPGFLLKSDGYLGNEKIQNNHWIALDEIVEIAFYFRPELASDFWQLDFILTGNKSWATSISMEGEPDEEGFEAGIDAFTEHFRFDLRPQFEEELAAVKADPRRARVKSLWTNPDPEVQGKANDPLAPDSSGTLGIDNEAIYVVDFGIKRQISLQDIACIYTAYQKSWGHKVWILAIE